MRRKVRRGSEGVLRLHPLWGCFGNVRIIIIFFDAWRYSNIMDTLSNNRLKSLAAYRQQKNCEADGLFVVEGVKMAGEALRSGWTIRTLCATSEALTALREVDIRAGELYQASPEQIDRLSSLRTPQGIWMLVERERPLEASQSRSDDFILMLDGIQDPGNMGTILRTADWFGVRMVICSQGTVSCYNPKVVQASMGAIFRTRVIYCDLAETITQYAAEGYTAYGAMLDGDDAFASPKVKPSLLVIGNEGHGISEEVSAVVGHRLTIPNIGGTCESLNAAVATAILMSEFYR